MFKEEVEELVAYALKEKTSLEAYFGNYSLQGVSGNPWKPDVVIVDTIFSDSEALNYGVKLIAEIKMQDYDFIKENKPKYNTWKEHMWRAYARLGDMTNWEVPKYLLVPYLELRGKFDFFPYFETINVTLLDWSKTEHIEIFGKKIKEL